MSIVCCKITKDKIEIGSDSITVRGCTQSKDGRIKHSKLFRVNDIIIGTAGKASEGGLLQIFCKTHSPKDYTEDSILEFIAEFAEWKRKKTENYNLENDYIIGYGNKAFLVNGFFVGEILKYEAIGAGMDYALAVLYNKGTVKEAVKTACALSIFCEEPIEIMTIIKERK